MSYYNADEAILFEWELKIPKKTFAQKGGTKKRPSLPGVWKRIGPLKSHLINL
jgi:hypothetical protein